MIEKILPATVIVEEALSDPADVVLFTEEEAALGQVVEQRRREFTTARACARRSARAPRPAAGASTHGRPR